MENPYTREKVQAMSGQQLSFELRKLGVNRGSRPNEELRELLIKKGKEMNKNNRANERMANKTDDILATINANLIALNENVKKQTEMLESLLGDVRTSTVSVDGQITAQSEMIEDIFLSIDELKNVASRTQKPKPVENKPAKPIERDILDSEIEQFVKSLNPFAIANAKTTKAYADLKVWCQPRKLIPCTQTKLSRAVCREYPFKVDHGYFVAISK